MTRDTCELCRGPRTPFTTSLCSACFAKQMVTLTARIDKKAADIGVAWLTMRDNILNDPRQPNDVIKWALAHIDEANIA